MYLEYVREYYNFYLQNNLQYPGYSVSYNASKDIVNKLRKFNIMCGTIRRTFMSASKGTRLKFYKVKMCIRDRCKNFINQARGRVYSPWS